MKTTVAFLLLWTLCAGSATAARAVCGAPHHRNGNEAKRSRGVAARHVTRPGIERTKWSEHIEGNLVVLLTSCFAPRR